jgi:deoxyribose-phosphate aldolase
LSLHWPHWVNFATQYTSMQLNAYIDHTVLKPTTSVSDIVKLCNEAIEFNFAAVCVPPPFVKRSKELLKDRNIKVATVIGFPFGYSAVEAKLAEILLSIVDCADELDVVINFLAIKNNDWDYVANEINHIMPIIKANGKVIKVIIESGVLTEEEIIKCCTLYGVAGIDYLKTSTGYAENGASVETVALMRKHLPANIQIKASGGIRDYQFAKQLVEAGATRLGCSASVAIVQQQVVEEKGY